MGEQAGPELITVREARERLGISRVTMARLMKEGHFTVYVNPLDRREKLLDVAELEKVRRPRKATPALDEQASKIAA